MKLNDHDLEILQATTTGKTIQHKDADGQWCDCTQFYDVWAQIAAGLHLTANDSHLIEYRVKPESDHIPDVTKMVGLPIPKQLKE